MIWLLILVWSVEDLGWEIRRSGLPVKKEREEGLWLTVWNFEDCGVELVLLKGSAEEVDAAVDGVG